MLITRILMNAADQGGGGTGQPSGGETPPAPATPAPAPAPTPPAPAPAQPQAQGGAASVPVTLDQIRQLMAESEQRSHDRVFAALNKAGVLGKPRPAAAPASTGDQFAGAQPAPAPPLPVDLGRMRALDRALARNNLATALDEDQYARLERNYTHEQPDDVDGWVRRYFPNSVASPPSQPTPASSASAPAAPPATAPAPQPVAAPSHPTPPPQPTNTVPVTDRGSPPVPSVPLEERQLISMTPAERDELVRRKGAAWFTQRLQQQLKDSNVRVSLRG